MVNQEHGVYNESRQDNPWNQKVRFSYILHLLLVLEVPQGAPDFVSHNSCRGMKRVMMAGRL